MLSLRYYEKQPHGTVEFPAEYHYVDIHHPRYFMPFHWHKEWELIRVVRGSCTIHADEQVFTAHAGDVVLWRDGMLHGCVPKEGCVYECFLFDLHGLFRNAEGIKQHLRPVYRLQLLPRILYPAKAHPTIHRIVSQIMDSCTVGDTAVEYDELLLLGSICSLFAHILRDDLHAENPEHLPHHSHRIELVKTVLEYIEQEYASPITLDDLAELAGMSRNYFCKVFKEILQQTPIDYLLHYRVEQAAALLASSAAPITDIAMDCGFNDHSYFIRVFKRLKGVTPKQYQLASGALSHRL